MKRALIVAATGGFLNGFLIPDMKLLQEMGYEVIARQMEIRFLLLYLKSDLRLLELRFTRLISHRHLH